MNAIVATTTWNCVDLISSFLEHYQRLGFQRVLVMDFNSIDGSRDLLTSDETVTNVAVFDDGATRRGLPGADGFTALMDASEYVLGVSDPDGGARLGEGGYRVEILDVDPREHPDHYVLKVADLKLLPAIPEDVRILFEGDRTIVFRAEPESAIARSRKRPWWKRPFVLGKKPKFFVDAIALRTASRLAITSPAFSISGAARRMAARMTRVPSAA